MIGAGLAAVRALEVAVLDERDRRVDRAADVVALRVDVVGEVDDRVGGGAELAGADVLRQEPHDAGDHEGDAAGR